MVPSRLCGCFCTCLFAKQGLFRLRTDITDDCYSISNNKIVLLTSCSFSVEATSSYMSSESWLFVGRLSVYMFCSEYLLCIKLKNSRKKSTINHIHYYCVLFIHIFCMFAGKNKKPYSLHGGLGRIHYTGYPFRVYIVVGKILRVSFGSCLWE